MKKATIIGAGVLAAMLVVGLVLAGAGYVRLHRAVTLPNVPLPNVPLVVDTKGWPQWRGPMRDGVAPSSPALIDSFPEQGPPILWKSARIEGDKEGGWGSMAVVDGRVYFLCHCLMAASGPRVLRKGATSLSGWVPGMPENLVREVEEARLSEARKQLTDSRESLAWATTWVKTHLKPEYSKYREVVRRRLAQGPAALPLEVVKKLEAIEDKQFSSQKELDRWFDANGVDPALRRTVMMRVSAKEPMDYVYCLSLSKGKTIWRSKLSSEWLVHPDSSTPCVVAGRCYIMNSQGKLFCLNAADGRALWSSEPLATPEDENRSSSVLIVDGLPNNQPRLAVVSTRRGTFGLDADSGKVVWTNSRLKSETASSVIWEHKGEKYLLVNANEMLSCLDPGSGKSLWSVPGGGAATPVVVGDCVVFCGGTKTVGVTAYRLSVEKPTEMWNIEFTDTHTSPLVYDGHVYVFGEGYGKKEEAGRGLCIELETGKVCWDERMGRAQLSSPIVADGKIMVEIWRGFYMIRATPEKYDLLGKVSIAGSGWWWTTPAFVDGRLLVRLNKGIVCYDMRKPGSTSAAAGAGK